MKLGKIFCVQLFLLLMLLLMELPLFLKMRNMEPATAQSKNEVYTISVRKGEEAAPMELEEYLVGAVLSEMPANFEAEALKAQAVAARTFAWRTSSTGGKHRDGSVCTDPSCCQGYVAPGRYLQRYGTEEDLKKVRTAVLETDGLVLTYQGELIEATYFSSAAGYTEDAAAVWGQDYPYLVSQKSPEDVREETAAFSSAYLAEALGIELGEDASTWFSAWQLTAGQGVASVKIGDRVFTGTALRKNLGLRSTAFTVTIQNDVIYFHTKGFGHRVGMSQYGADAMAAAGKNFEEILSHYYSGTSLQKISYLKRT